MLAGDTNGVVGERGGKEGEEERHATLMYMYIICIYIICIYIYIVAFAVGAAFGRNPKKKSLARVRLDTRTLERDGVK